MHPMPIGACNPMLSPIRVFRCNDFDINLITFLRFNQRRLSSALPCGPPFFWRCADSCTFVYFRLCCVQIGAHFRQARSLREDHDRPSDDAAVSLIDGILPAWHTGCADGRVDGIAENAVVQGCRMMSELQLPLYCSVPHSYVPSTNTSPVTCRLESPRLVELSHRV